MQRVVKGLSEAREHLKKGNTPEIRTINAARRDYVVGASAMEGPLDHIMGPTKTDFMQACENMMVEKARKILTNKTKSFHCVEEKMCEKFRMRAL